MSIIVDTNILVRAITLDPPREGKKAADILRANDVVVPTIAICEMIRVLLGLYKLNRSEVIQAIRALLGVERVTLDRSAVEAGLAMMETGGDFADGAIAFEGRRLGGETFASFDKKAVALLGAGGHECLLLQRD